MAMLSKWLWRFRNEPHSLWRLVISSIHESKRSWAAFPLSSNCTGTWKNIVKSVMKVNVSGTGLNNLIKGNVGNGSTVRFWLDPWLCNISLKEKFPNLFKLEGSKRCYVSDRYNFLSDSFMENWNWTRGFRNGPEVQEWAELGTMVGSVRLSNRQDSWRWLGGVDKEFSVKEVKKFLLNDRDYSSCFVFKWINWVPKKCNILLWRAEMNRIPTMLALKDRNCNFGDDRCGLCSNAPESVDHLFGACEIAMKVWLNIGEWCKVRPIFIFSFRDVFKLHKLVGLGKRARKIFKGIVAVTCWNLWKARNDNKFSNIDVIVGKITMLIKVNSYRWYKNRMKKDKVRWIDWCNFNVT